MLKASLEISNNLSVIRRLVFASAVLPSDCPKYWEIVSSFATDQVKSHPILTAARAKTFIENLQFIEPNTFTFDQQLHLHLQSYTAHLGKPIGLVLVSTNITCKLCDSDLLVKADRSSKVTVYSDQFGTVSGTHFRKICKRFRNGCQFVQHYGFYSNGGEKVIYNDDYKSLPYFMSTRETAFEMSLLKQFDVEILIGQLSYNQRSDIYNLKHGYDKAKKKVHATQKETLR